MVLGIPFSNYHRTSDMLTRGYPEPVLRMTAWTAKTDIPCNPCKTVCLTELVLRGYKGGRKEKKCPGRQLSVMGAGSHAARILLYINI